MSIEYGTNGILYTRYGFMGDISTLRVTPLKKTLKIRNIIINVINICENTYDKRKALIP